MRFVTQTRKPTPGWKLGFAWLPVLLYEEKGTLLDTRGWLWLEEFEYRHLYDDERCDNRVTEYRPLP